MSAPAPDLSPMEAAIVARFEAADPALESYGATTDPLDVLQAALDAATPGPWNVSVETDGVWVEAPDGEWPAEVYGERRGADAAAIVALRNAAPDLLTAIRNVRALHVPVEWQECDEDGVPDLDKPLAPFCRGCTDDEYVAAVEFGDTIDQGDPVVSWPCSTIATLGSFGGQQ